MKKLFVLLAFGLIAQIIYSQRTDTIFSSNYIGPCHYDQMLVRTYSGKNHISRVEDYRRFNQFCVWASYTFVDYVTDKRGVSYAIKQRNFNFYTGQDSLVNLPKYKFDKKMRLVYKKENNLKVKTVETYQYNDRDSLISKKIYFRNYNILDRFIPVSTTKTKYGNAGQFVSEITKERKDITKELKYSVFTKVRYPSLHVDSLKWLFVYKKPSKKEIEARFLEYGDTLAFQFESFKIYKYDSLWRLVDESHYYVTDGLAKEYQNSHFQYEYPDLNTVVKIFANYGKIYKQINRIEKDSSWIIKTREDYVKIGFDEWFGGVTHVQKTHLYNHSVYNKHWNTDFANKKMIPVSAQLSYIDSLGKVKIIDLTEDDKPINFNDLYKERKWTYSSISNDTTFTHAYNTSLLKWYVTHKQYYIKDDNICLINVYYKYEPQTDSLIVTDTVSYMYVTKLYPFLRSVHSKKLQSSWSKIEFSKSATFNKGYGFYSNGDYKAAIPFFRLAIKEDSLNAFAYCYLASSKERLSRKLPYVRIGSFDEEAHMCFEIATSLLPKYNFCEAYIYIGRYEGKYMLRDDDDFYKAGSMYYKGISKPFAKAQKLEPLNPDCYLQRYYAYDFGMGPSSNFLWEVENAIKAAEKALKKDSANTLYLHIVYEAAEASRSKNPFVLKAYKKLMDLDSANAESYILAIANFYGRTIKPELLQQKLEELSQISKLYKFTKGREWPSVTEVVRSLK